MANAPKTDDPGSLRADLKALHALLVLRDDMHARTYPGTIARDVLATQEAMHGDVAEAGWDCRQALARVMRYPDLEWQRAAAAFGSGRRTEALARLQQGLRRPDMRYARHTEQSDLVDAADAAARRWHAVAMDLPDDRVLSRMEDQCRRADCRLRDARAAVRDNPLARYLAGGDPVGEGDPLAAPLVAFAAGLHTRLQQVRPAWRHETIKGLPDALMATLRQSADLAADRGRSPER